MFEKMLLFSKNYSVFHQNYLFRSCRTQVQAITCQSCKAASEIPRFSTQTPSNLKIRTRHHHRSQRHPTTLTMPNKVALDNAIFSCKRFDNQMGGSLACNLSFTLKMPRRPFTTVTHSLNLNKDLIVDVRIRAKESRGFCSTTLAPAGREKQQLQLEPKQVVKDVHPAERIKLSDSSTAHHRTSSYMQTNPKSVVHNIYQVVAKELDSSDYKVTPTYRAIRDDKSRASWACTYSIKWPEPLKFTAQEPSRKHASHSAALQVINWLRKNEKITRDGHPIIIDKAEVADLVKSNIPKLRIDKLTTTELRSIVTLYKQDFVPLLVDGLDKKSQVNLDEAAEIRGVKLKRQPRLLDPEKYLSKEKCELPISAYKEAFIELLDKNRVIIIKGEPGCGKSTRIPQYVLESWIRDAKFDSTSCRIAVTQPRRIAAISLSERVANERSESSGHIVGYQVRLKSDFNPALGRILYCTTGILLRHLQSDPTLSTFSHIILDEAHERDVNTDLLMNLLRHTLERNPDLKLIVMSATVDTDLFKRYYEDAPILHIPGFTHPVKTHFLDDLRDLDLSKTRKMAENESPIVIHEDLVRVLKFIHRTKPEGAILCFLPGWEDISKVQKLVTASAPGDVCVLCLHSRLQDSDQRKIFSRAPPGVRKIILATNIAETSVTIDDVVYVVDTGIHKENRFDNDKGVHCIDNHWISKSSMIQRKGRAGRVQPGESFHLYPKSKYQTFPQFTDPEILKTSLTKIVLDSKVYTNNMNALEFMSQLPSPPDKDVTRRAVRELKDLELLDEEENLTPLGKTLAKFQLEPKLAKVLVNAVVYKCVTPIVDIVTLFSSDMEIFQGGLLNKERIKSIKTRCCKDSDHLALMRLFEKWLELMEEEGQERAVRFCEDTNLVHHKLFTIEKLRQIHFDYLHSGLHNSLPITDTYSDNDEIVKAILFSAVGTLLQHRKWDVVKGRYKKSNVFLTMYNHKATIASESVNFKKTWFPSNFLVYINEVRSNIRRTTVVRECSVMSPLSVLLFANRKLVTSTVSADNDDEVFLSLKDSKVSFLCSKEEADDILKCKEALENVYQYFIFHLTEGGECNERANKIWEKMLLHVDRLLTHHQK